MANKQNIKKVSQKTKQKKEMVHGQVMKQLSMSAPTVSNKGEFYYRLKMLEFNNIKTFETSKIGIAVVKKQIEDRLSNSSLNNKQKAEVLLVAQIEAYQVVDALTQSIE